MKKVNLRLQSAVNFLKLPNCKRSQITLIIIIAIVLVWGLLMFFAFKDKINFKEKVISPDAAPIYNQVKTCVEQKLLSAVWLVGMQGGYASTPKDYIKTPFSNVAYGLKNGKITLANIQTMEQEITGQLALSLPYCVNNQDANVHFNEPIIKTKINDKSVSSLVRMPFYVTKDGSTTEVDQEYKTEIPIRLGKIHDLAMQILNEQKNIGKYVPLSLLSEIETEIVFDYYDSDTVYYVIHDEESKVDNIIYNFMFAVELNEDKENEIQ